MARIVIVIEDAMGPGGKEGVKVISDPAWSEMMQMNQVGHKLTSAHGYAFKALNAIRDAAKEQADGRLIVKFPKLGKH